MLSTHSYTYKTKTERKVTIREACLQDAERMLKAAPKALVDAPYMLTTVEDLEKLSLEDIKRELEYYAANANYLKLVAEYENEIVGVIDFRNGNKEKIAHQGSLAMTVLPHFRNLGVGRALLESLISWGKNSKTIEKICLEVMEDNHGAIQLYKSLNFVEEGRKAKAVKMDGRYQDLIMMALFV
ncbi:GNAT family N-acetyltransferase [Fictibacillus nanhaiensis]|uniref:GNAT family N-acetyltransferase n=1 Tax=Fictibacillus nanhaiensis TaxID=742169 RepID=A0ABS2ZSH3_9BACL|nr:GNAT family N-acetyltransferase [Fictibacillus nanhaiensis]